MALLAFAFDAVGALFDGVAVCEADGPSRAHDVPCFGVASDLLECVEVEVCESKG